VLYWATHLENLICQYPGRKTRNMNYEALQGMALDSLLDLLAQNTTELLKAIEKKDRRMTHQLQNQVELIQEVIAQKKLHRNDVT